jgi:hypothetical protein
MQSHTCTIGFIGETTYHKPRIKTKISTHEPKTRIMLKSNAIELHDVSIDLFHFLTLFYKHVHASKSRQKMRETFAFYSLTSLQMFYSTSVPLKSL